MRTIVNVALVHGGSSWKNCAKAMQAYRDRDDRRPLLPLEGAANIQPEPEARLSLPWLRVP